MNARHRGPGLFVFILAPWLCGSVVAQNSSGSAYGESVDLTVQSLLGAPLVAVESGPLPRVEGETPPDFNENDSVASVDVGADITLVTLTSLDILETDVINVSTMGDGTPQADTSAEVNGLDLLLVGGAFGLTDLTLFSIGGANNTLTSVATAGGSCDAGLTASGDSVLENLELGGVVADLIGVSASISANPDPNTILLDIDLGDFPILNLVAGGSIQIILNEQIETGDGITSAGITVNALHVMVEDLTVMVPLTGPVLEVDGDVIVSQSVAEATCPTSDLAVAKVDDIDPIPVLDVLTYTVTVTNNGPEAAENVQVVDTLDPTVSFISATPSQGSCMEASLVVTCDLGFLPAVPPGAAGSAFGELIDLNIDSSLVPAGVDVDSGPQPMVSGAAPPPFNEMDSVVSINEMVDVQLGLPPLLPMQLNVLSTGTVNVATSGDETTPEAASAASVEDLSLSVLEPVPAVLDLFLDLSADVVSSSASVTGTCGALGTSGTTDIIGGALDSDIDPLDDFAGLLDPAPPANTVLLDLPILGGNITILLNEQIITGDGVTSAGIIVNAIHIIIEDVGLPILDPANQVIDIDGEIIIAQSVAQADCSEDGVATIDIQVQPQQPGVIFNNVEVTSDSIDDDDGNDTAEEPTTVLAQADISITKTDGTDTVTAGSQTVYTIVVTNNGPSDDPSVTVTDIFPPELDCTWTSVAAGGASGNTPGPINAGIDETLNMPAGSSVTYSATCDIDPKASGSLVNTASVTPSEDDPDEDNNEDTDTDQIEGEADLSVSKSDGTDTVTAGSQTTYTIVVSNDGPSDVVGASLGDTFPGTLSCSWTSVAAGGASGNTAGPVNGDISESLDLPVGSSVTYTAVCDIDPGASGTLVNTATVTPPQGVTDPDPGDNSDTDTNDIVQSADLSVTKTDGTATATAGGQTTYSIVVSNHGPSHVSGASVSDVFPGTLSCSWTSVASGGASGNTPGPVNGDISDTVDLPVGSSVTYTALCAIDSDASGTLINTAVVETPQGVDDPDPKNNTDTDVDDIVQSADLAVSKDNGTDSVTAGSPTTYTIVVSNNGPSDDPSVSVSDIFPTELTGCTYTSIAAGGATGNTAAGAGNIADTLSMPTGSSVTYTATCDIDPKASGTLENTATVTPSVSDPNEDNNMDTDTDQIEGEADLSITKSNGVDMVTAGEQTTYTIVVGNAGPSDVAAASVNDTFPGTLSCSWTSVAAGGASGNTPGPVVGNISDSVNLPVGGTVTYTAVCDIDSSASGSLVNTATVTEPPGITDSNQGNNSDTDTDEIVSEADLAVTKDNGTDTVTAGEQTTYTMVVSNNGPSDDPSVSVTDSFPAELMNCSYTSIAAGGASGNTAAGAGNIADTLNMPAGSSVTYTATCDIAADATGSLANTVIVSASVNDPDKGNDTATDTDDILSEADLAVTKDNGTDTVTAGQQTTYTMVVSNNGPSDDPSVSVTDSFPAELMNCSFTSIAAGGASGNTAAGAGDISDTLSMPVGSSVTYTATCDIAADATGLVENTIVVSASVNDPDDSNDTATDTDDIVGEADLSVTKDNGTTTVMAGGSTTYTIVVSNAGPSDDPSVGFSDVFPTELTGCTYTSSPAGGATGNTAAGAGDISDTLSMPAGSSVTYTVTCNVDAKASGILENTATATPSVNDPDPSNNSATDTDQIEGEADLSISKSDGTDSVEAGGQTTYTIVVINDGPSDVIGASVSDSFPAELDCTWVSVAADGASGNTPGPVNGDISDTVDLPVGSSITYVAECDIDPGASGTVVNTATVTEPPGITDPNQENNSATDTDNIPGEADLSVTKDNGTDTVTAGGQTTYTIVASNAGPSDVTGAMVSDDIPGNVNCSWTSVAMNGASGNTAGPVNGDIIEVINLPVGSSVTYTVDCDVAPDASGTLTNTVNIAPPQGVTDPNLGNNSDTDSDDIVTEADLAITKVDDPDPVEVGEVLTYTIEVTNNGPSDASNVIVTDTIPDGTTLIDADTSPGNCSGEPVVICDLGTIAAGEMVSIIITVRAPDEPGTIENVASVSGDDPDPDPDNNQAIEDTEVEVSDVARFTVTKDFDDDSTAGVQVYIECTTGLPMTSDATLYEFHEIFDEIEFVVQDFDQGELDCSIFEDVPDGYTASYSASLGEGGVAGDVGNEDGCQFVEVEGGDFACQITNRLDQVRVTVDKIWIDELATANGAFLFAGARWHCDPVADLNDVPWWEEVRWGHLTFFGSLSGYREAGDPAELWDNDSFWFYPHFEGSNCSVTELELDGDVFSDDSDCEDLEIFPGHEAGEPDCVIINTRIYAGIPTLSQYGLVLLALLMLGVGLVGHRRFA